MRFRYLYDIIELIISFHKYFFSKELMSHLRVMSKLRYSII